MISKRSSPSAGGGACATAVEANVRSGRKRGERRKALESLNMESHVRIKGSGGIR